MTNSKSCLTFIFLTLVAACPHTPATGAQAVETPEQHDIRMAWWREARFGMFIHWDMSSLAGTEISWSRKASRPLDVDNAPAGYVEDPVYDHLYEKFNPTNFNAAEWVSLAKKAGMKYIVFTAKHHGGFCMWDTKFTDYSIMHTPFKRDVVRELSEACHAAGLRFGLYYSPRDWHHPDYGIGDNAKYHQYLKGQLTELLTHYGKVDVMWFDSFGKGDSIKYWHADEILALVKQLQPEIIINNRCSYFGQQVASLAGDFDTPEQRLGEFQNTRDWESCMCLVNAPGGGWSYRTDGQVKSFADALKTLLGCATGDGNLLLDVGPDSIGVIPADQAGRLVEMGDWLRKYGESIYGTHGGPWKPTKAAASTRQGNTIFLHVFQWDGGQITLPDIARKVKSARLLAGGKAEVTQLNEQLVVRVPVSAHETGDTVIRLELDGSAMDLPVMAGTLITKPAVKFPTREIPTNCPFAPSDTLVGLTFTGRHAEYAGADTWYPSWAADGNLYSPWTDGSVNGVGAGSMGRNATTGFAKIIGDDPLQLQIVEPGVYKSDPSPYAGRYPCGSLVYQGVWYYGTYCLNPSGEVRRDGQLYNWPWLGPFVGFRTSTNYGATWTQTPCTPEKPLFGEHALNGEQVKIGSPHFVDFGKNLEHSPDGKAYLVAHGASDGVNRRFAFNSWITGDEIYLLRVKPGLKNMNNAAKYEFFAGRHRKGKAVWSRDFAETKPIAAWRDNMGCVTMTYNAPLKKYLMCVTDGGTTVSSFNTYILESDRVTGPFKLVTYLRSFGEQAYFVNIPSKFISSDGRTFWLCYAANFTTVWKGIKLQQNPPGSHYAMCLQEVKLSKPN